MTMLYPNLCFKNMMRYKRTALYFIDLGKLIPLMLLSYLGLTLKLHARIQRVGGVDKGSRPP